MGRDTFSAKAGGAMAVKHKKSTDRTSSALFMEWPLFTIPPSVIPAWTDWPFR
jgi:hypothetical protein